MADYNGLRFELSIRNVDAVVANFHKADAELIAVVKAVVQRYGAMTKELTQFFCPVDTGFMQANVKTVFTPAGFGWETGWDASDFIGAGKPFYPFFQEFGTINHPAQASLGPAYEEVAPQFQLELREAIVASIARLENHA